MTENLLFTPKNWRTSPFHWEVNSGKSVESLLGAASDVCLLLLSSPTGSVCVSSTLNFGGEGVSAAMEELAWFGPGVSKSSRNRTSCCSCSCISLASCLVFGGWTAGGGATPLSLSISSRRVMRLDRDDMYALDIGLFVLKCQKICYNARFAGVYDVRSLVIHTFASRHRFL